MVNQVEKVESIVLVEEEDIMTIIEEDFVVIVVMQQDFDVKEEVQG